MTVRLIREASLVDIKREMGQMFHEGMVDPSVKRLAEEAVAGKPDQISAVFEFVRSTFPYVPDPESAELFIHPRVRAEAYFRSEIRGGDCDDAALLTAAMYGALGYRTRILLVDSGSGDLDHALAQVSTNIGWINADTTDTQNPLGWVKNFGQTVIIE